jgi:hypothetical protein
MKIIIHHPDGVVYVYNGTKKYVERASQFAADAASAGVESPLSERSAYWQYDMATGFNEVGSNGQHGPVQAGRWVAGENAIKSIDALLAVQAARAGISSSVV